MEDEDCEDEEIDDEDFEDDEEEETQNEEPQKCEWWTKNRNSPPKCSTQIDWQPAKKQQYANVDLRQNLCRTNHMHTIKRQVR